MNNLPDYRYRGAAALVSLHEIHILNFFDTWKKSAEKNIQLPETSDPDYESLDSLLYHVCNSSRNYLLWICRNLKLPDPLINEVPAADLIRTSAEDYIKYLLHKWKYPLKDIQEVVFDQVFKSNWGVEFSIEAMLEHAVMHPIRHEFQLKNLIAQQGNS